MGIKNTSSVQYLNGYLNSNDEIPHISVDNVLKSVGVIESMIKFKKETRKAVIVNTG